MVTWQIMCVLGIAFIILEIFTPSMFFLNFALASFITAISSLFIAKAIVLVVIFFVFSFLSFIFLRPIILNKSKNVEKTGIEEKYIGKIVKVIDEVTSSSGAVSIYDERWNAKSKNGDVFAIGSEVKIVAHEGLVMIVEKIDK